MFTVDPASFILTNSLVSLALSAVLLVSRVGMGAEGRGIGVWVVGDLTLAAAHLAILNPGGLPFGLGLPFPVATGCFMAVGVVTHVHALRLVAGHVARPWVVASQSLGAAALFYLVMLPPASVADRLHVFNFMLLCASLATLRVLWPLMRFWGARLIALMMIVALVFQGVRLSAALLGWGTAASGAMEGGLLGSVRVGDMALDLLIGLVVTAGFTLLIQERLRERIERLVVTDALTGSLNRHGIMPLLNGALAQAHRHGRPLSVVMFDLDHFKRINDQHGHATGDQVLAGFAAHVGAQLRESDQLSRWGGEEFLLLLADTERAAAHAVAERLRQSVAQTPMDGQGLQVTVSAGVASLEGGGLQPQAPTARSLLELLDTADRRLYLAKRQRNCVVSSEDEAPAMPTGAAASSVAQAA